jgi:hypothetical protein
MPTNRRQGVLARAMFELLMEKPEGVPIAQLLTLVEERVPPTSSEQSNLGRWTIGLERAGWLIKDNGHWSVTDKGRWAYADYPDPEDLQHEWNRLYQFSQKKKR